MKSVLGNGIHEDVVTLVLTLCKTVELDSALGPVNILHAWESVKFLLLDQRIILLYWRVK